MTKSSRERKTSVISRSFTMSSTLVMHCGAFLLSRTIGSVRSSTFMMPAPAWLIWLRWPIWLRWQERSTVSVSARPRKRRQEREQNFCVSGCRGEVWAHLTLQMQLCKKLWTEDRSRRQVCCCLSGKWTNSKFSPFSWPHLKDVRKRCSVISNRLTPEVVRESCSATSQTCFFTLECAGGLFQLTETWSKSRLVSVWPTGLSAWCVVSHASDAMTSPRLSRFCSHGVSPSSSRVEIFFKSNARTLLLLRLLRDLHLWRFLCRISLYSPKLVVPFPFILCGMVGVIFQS